MPALFTNQDAAIVELRAKLAQVTAERDRARDIAVALEQRISATEAVIEQHEPFHPALTREVIPARLRAALRGGAA